MPATHVGVVEPDRAVPPDYVLPGSERHREAGVGPRDNAELGGTGRPRRPPASRRRTAETDPGARPDAAGRERRRRIERRPV